MNRDLVSHCVVFLLLTLFALNAFASEEPLRGTVTDRGGSAVVGALVQIKSGAVVSRVISNDLGAFVFPLNLVLSSAPVVRVSAPGFSPTEIQLSDQRGEALHFVLHAAPLFSGEVEVTTNRADIKATPVTVSNISGEEIARKNWGQDVPLLLRHVPGFYSYNDNGQGMGYSYFFLRGFDMRRNAVSLNGVPLNDAESHGVYFVDLANFLATTGDIQIQRGVGTNLFGGSAIGGSVDLRTRAPLTERRMRASTMVGSWGTRRFDLEFDSGLTDDDWALTFRYSRTDSDGYRDQSWLESWNYYAAIEKFGAHSTSRFIFFGGPEETHLAYEGVTREYLEGRVTGDRRRDRRHNPLTYSGEIDTFFQPHFQFVNSWAATKDLVVNNTVFFFEGQGYYEQFKEDRWFPEYDLQPFTGPDGEIVNSTNLVRRREVGEWDAGWVSALELSHGSGKGKLEAGAAIRIHEGHHWGQTRWAQMYPPDTEPNHRYYDYKVDKRTLQPFVQETWRINREWGLFGGLTWTSHRYELHDDKRGQVEFTETFEYLLPRLGLSYFPSENVNFYANISRGGREPSFRDIYDPQDYWFGDEPHDLEPEKVTDFEIGGRFQWPSGYANVNAYFLDFDNAIVWAGGLDSDGLPITANGATTTHRGVEVEAIYSPRPRFGTRFTLSYTDATFKDFKEFDWDGTYRDFSGNRIAGVPDWLASLDLSGGWAMIDALLSIRYVGEFFLDNTEDGAGDLELRLDPAYIHRVNEAFTSVDIAVEYDLGEKVPALVGARKGKLNLRVNNLLDDLHTTFGYVWGPEPTWIPAATRSIYGGIAVDW